MANEPNPQPIMVPVDDGDPRSLENRIARADMRRENAASSVPRAAIRRMERQAGARR